MVKIEIIKTDDKIYIITPEKVWEFHAHELNDLQFLKFLIKQLEIPV
jgi:hypothetical protein